eukprot:s36_g29.t1
MQMRSSRNCDAGSFQYLLTYIGHKSASLDQEADVVIGQLSQEAASLEIASKLAGKGFCVVSAGFEDSILRRAVDEDRSPEPCVLQFSEGSALVAELESPERDPAAREDGEVLQELDTAITHLGFHIEPYLASFGVEVSHRGRAVVHQAGEPGEERVPLNDKEVFPTCSPLCPYSTSCVVVACMASFDDQGAWRFLSSWPRSGGIFSSFGGAVDALVEAQAIADHEPDEAARRTVRQRRQRAEELGRRALMLQQTVGQTLGRLEEETVSEYSELGHTTVAIAILTSSADLTSLCGLLDTSLQLVQDLGCFRTGWRILHIQAATQSHRVPNCQRAPKPFAWSAGTVANFDSVGPKAVAPAGHCLAHSCKVLDRPVPAEAADKAESSTDAVAWSSWNSSTWDKARSGPSPPTRRDHERHLSKLNAARRNIECVPDLFSEIVSSKRSKANEDVLILVADDADPTALTTVEAKNQVNGIATAPVRTAESLLCLPGRGRLELSMVVRQEPKTVKLIQLRSRGISRHRIVEGRLGRALANAWQQDTPPGPWVHADVPPSEEAIQRVLMRGHLVPPNASVQGQCYVILAVPLLDAVSHQARRLDGWAPWSYEAQGWTYGSRANSCMSLSQV